MAFIQCKSCKRLIPSTAKTCTSCGCANSKPIPFFWLTFFGIVFTAFLAVYNLQ